MLRPEWLVTPPGWLGPCVMCEFLADVNCIIDVMSWMEGNGSLHSFDHAATAQLVYDHGERHAPQVHWQPQT